MKWMKYKILVAGGAVCLLAAGASVYLLLSARARCVQATAELDAAKQKLDRLQRRDPFPSDDNTERVRAGVSNVQHAVTRILQDMAAGQPGGETMEPAKFSSFLDATRRDLRKRAADAGCKLPDTFTIGFSRYMAGEPPAATDLPRLVSQTKSLSAVCGQIVDAKASELMDICRIAFETATGSDGAPATTGEGGLASVLVTGISLPPVESNELFSAERIGVVFQAREEVAWSLIQSFTTNQPFVVVRHVELENPLNPRERVPGGGGLTPPTAAPGPDGAGQPVYPPREDRMVAGRELVKVGLVIDVYSFVLPAVEGGS